MNSNARTLAIQTVYRPYRTYGEPSMYTEMGDAYGKGGGVNPDVLASLIGTAGGIFGPLVGGIGGKKQREHEMAVLNQQLELERLRASQGIKPLHIVVGLGAVALLGVAAWALVR